MAAGVAGRALGIALLSRRLEQCARRMGHRGADPQVTPVLLRGCPAGAAALEHGVIGQSLRLPAGGERHAVLLWAAGPLCPGAGRVASRAVGRAARRPEPAWLPRPGLR